MDELKKTGAVKRQVPETLPTTVVIRNETPQRNKRQQNAESEGGSAIISIPTPSKTRKTHQGKRSHYSSKSTFKRRKYTEE
jgi:hypothetical protein